MTEFDDVFAPAPKTGEIFTDVPITVYRTGEGWSDRLSQSSLKACGGEDVVSFMNSWVGSVVHRFMELGLVAEQKIYEEFMTIDAVLQFKKQRKMEDRDHDAVFARSMKMAASLIGDLPLTPEINEIYRDTDSLAEASVKYEFCNLKMKCRPDVISADRQVIIDWKTTGDIEAFESSIWKYMYDVQAFSYLTAVGGARFIFAVVDKNTYQTGIYEMSPEAIQIGYVRMLDLIERWNCTQQGARYTATKNTVKTVNPPGWIKYR